MTGYLPVEDIRKMWPDFDVAVHVPISENCGGVGEPMLAGVPVVAGRVGGLPELIVDGVTGILVPVRNPLALAQAILGVLDSPVAFRAVAQNAQVVACRMASTERIAHEMVAIYAHALGSTAQRPAFFEPLAVLDSNHIALAI